MMPNVTAITLFSFVSNMAFITPSVRAATLTEIAPVVAALAASRPAALTGEYATDVGTPADAAFCETNLTCLPR
jgi:hypothetical protein